MGQKKNNFNIFLFLLAPFKYFCLGCFYTLYGILYPFILVYNIIVSNIYKSYRKSMRKKDKHEVIKAVNLEMDTIDEKIKKNNETKDVQIIKSKESNNSNKRNKELDQKKLKYRNLLISEINNQEIVRTEYPSTYMYKARNSEGKDITGYLVAYTKQEVFNFLEAEGYLVYKLENNKFIELLYGQKQFSKRKLSTKDLIFWLTQLSTYLKSGIPLTDSMRILGMQMGKSDAFKKRLFDAIIYQLIMGESFSEALEKQGNAFPSLLINMIKAAEATGELEATLDDMSNYYNEMETTRKQMISAMTYPSAIMVFSIGVVTFILMYVVPQFTGIYESAGVELNALTSFVIAASAFLKSNIMYIIIGVIFIVLVIIYLYKNIKDIKYLMQKFAMKIPVFGKIIIYNEMTIFTKTFSSLLKNNVFITDTIEILTKITNNEIYKDIMYKTINNIASGEKISMSFKDNWAIPDVAYYMIVTGESTGELAEMMEKVSLYYQEEHKNIINSLKSLIEPIMILFLAVVVGGVVLSVIIPMFSLYGQIS